MDRTHILLANHHPIIRSSLRTLLEREPAFRVIGEAADDREASLLAEFQHPDVILLDLNLKPSGGLAVAREILRKSPQARIILIADQTDEEYVIEAFKTGAQGYVAADLATVDLVPAVGAVRAGKRFVSPSVRPNALSRASRADMME